MSQPGTRRFLIQAQRRCKQAGHTYRRREPLRGLHAEALYLLQAVRAGPEVGCCGRAACTARCFTLVPSSPSVAGRVGQEQISAR